MSLNALPIRKVISSIDTNTLDINTGVITIVGLEPFLTANVTRCWRTCAVACTPQVVTVTVAVPTEPCDCPYQWQIDVRSKQCTNSGMRVSEVFGSSELYGYNSPDGTTPTNDAVAEAIADMINANPYSIVEANWTSGATFTLTEKDCDSDKGTCGFTAGVLAGSVNVDTEHVDAVMKPADLRKQFPIGFGDFGTMPVPINCGDYCKYYLYVQGHNRVRDAHFDHVFNERDLEIELWVDSSLATFDADFDQPLATELPCLEALNS